MTARFMVLCALAIIFEGPFVAAELETQEIKTQQTATPAVVPQVAPVQQQTGAQVVARPGATPGQPIQYKAKDQPAAADSSSPPPDFSSIFGAITSGGGDKAVGSDGNGSATQGPGQTITNSLDMGGSAGYAGKEPLRTVNGCTNVPGKIQFKGISSEGALPSGCDSAVKMSETLSDLIDTNFTRCAKQAAGKNNTIDNIKIYDVGTLSDARHLKERPISLHSLGLAMDVRAIALGGDVYDASNPAFDDFFNKFRECWGQAVNGLRGGCLTNAHPGSVGNENSEERHHHLHISVPYCPQYAKANGIKIASLLELLTGSTASAAEVADGSSEGDANYPPKFKYQSIKLANGEALITYKDTGSEPVALNMRVTVGLKCKGQKAYKPVNENAFEGCGFAPATFDSAKGVLTVNLLASRRDEKGDQQCDQKSPRKVPLKCP